jgi:hypothetical protein
MTAPAIVCVYPLSPTYLILHRYLYYTSLIISVLYPTPPPLVKGAFAYSLTYSSTAALYAVLIVAIPVPADVRIINLDVFGLWAVLSTASILILPLLTWTRNLRGAGSSSARPIIRIWGLLILVGAACSFVLLGRARSLAADVAADAAAVSDCHAQALAADTAKLRLRDPSNVTTADYDRLFGSLFALLFSRLSPLAFIPLAFGALSCLVTIVDSSPSHIASGEITGTEVISTSLISGLRSLFLSLRKLVSALTACWLVPVLVVNELFLLKDWSGPDGMPEGEKMYEVGQWGLFAGLGLVAAAASVNWFAGRRMGERKGEDAFIA